MSDLTGDAQKLLARMRELPPRDSGEDLRPIEKQALLAMRAAGLTQTAIAAEIGCHQSTVSRIIGEYADTRPLARAALEAGALEMARNVLANGKPELHLKALAKLDVVRDDQAPQINVASQVIVADPNRPETWGSGPVFQCPETRKALGLAPEEDQSS